MTAKPDILRYAMSGDLYLDIGRPRSLRRRGLRGDFAKHAVRGPVRFIDQDHLLEVLAKEAIAPAEKLIEKRQRRLDEIFGRA